MSAERWALWAGAIVAVLAVSPPVDAAADRSLVTHMVQHLALVTVAAPLIGFGLPWRPGRRHWGAWVVAAVAVSSAALWVWHAPAPFDAAVRHAPLHAAEHLTLLGTAVWLWTVVTVPRRGAGVLALFAATVPATFLGAALTLSGHAWYAAYPSLGQQRIAGALMWAAGSAPGLLGATLVFAWWLSADQPSPSLSQ